jgi:tripartite-type tricarboxylate transporter receptor subunit TctC
MPTPSRYRSILVTAVGGLMVVGAAGQSFAADYPEKSVRMIVPFAPSGGTDVIGRVAAQKLTEKFGKQFVVENVPGAGGTIGAAAVARADPDGHTLLVYHIGLISTTFVYKPLPYDVLRDFAPIGQLSSAANVLAITASMPTRTLKEFIAVAKAKPGELSFGSSGVGGSDHLAAELFLRVANIKAVHVPYKGGGPATIAAVAGEVQFTAGTVSQVIGMILTNKLRPLAVMQKTRVASLPNCPTAPEAGLPDLNFTTWFALWGPAKIRPEVVGTLNKALQEVMSREDVRVALDKVGVEPAPTSTQQFDAMFKSEWTKWSKILGDVFAKQSF